MADENPKFEVVSYTLVRCNLSPNTCGFLHTTRKGNAFCWASGYEPPDQRVINGGIYRQCVTPETSVSTPDSSN